MNKINKNEKIISKLKNLKWMFFDVDGVLTDGSLYYGNNGETFKRFNSLDGHGIKQLFHIGVNVGLISGRDHKATRLRAEELGIKILMLDVSDKLEKFIIWTKKMGVNPEHCGHMGDDIADLNLLKFVGFSASVPNAVDEVKILVDYISKLNGGKGAVREVCDLITKHHE
jgi:3-deoxy-D-manno-octulosonate 8-phosphate phosphatase (KDO 8-P phosphatase)